MIYVTRRSASTNRQMNRKAKNNVCPLLNEARDFVTKDLADKLF